MDGRVRVVTSSPRGTLSPMGGDLLSRTEARRVATLDDLDAGTQARLGQFFTPERAAQLIASMPALPESGLLRVLDPGAGIGSLGAALVDRVLAHAPNVAVEVTAVEIDPRVAPQLRATMADCEASAARVGRQVSTNVIVCDFIESSVGLLAQQALQGPFDIVLMNPPYAKLGTDSPHRHALAAYGVDCPNLYAAFVTLGVGALAAGGQMVAITPRSFANGPYFERFRKHLLGSITIDRVHTFESRSTVFSDTGVLQENIVLAGTRQGEQGPVVLSKSVGHTDDATESVVPYEAIVLPDDPHGFLRVATDETDGVVGELMAQMPATLADLGLGVSTGRVVDFRVRESLRDAPVEGCAPLIYPGNLKGGMVVWPRDIRKAQAFVAESEAQRKALMPPGCYVLVKRFSAKEERRRIVAAVWDPRTMGHVSVAFENHLNVFHQDGEGVDRSLALGLSLWLNSTLVDQFFRTFSGHTQVNATDLRSLRFPTHDELVRLGEGRTPELPGQSEIDDLVAGLVKRRAEAA